MTTAKSESILDKTQEVVNSEVINEPQPPAPPDEKLLTKIVTVKNITKNPIYGVSGVIDPDKTGDITFQDFCNLSPVYVEEVK